MRSKYCLLLLRKWLSSFSIRAALGNYVCRHLSLKSGANQEGTELDSSLLLLQLEAPKLNTRVRKGVKKNPVIESTFSTSFSPALSL